MMMIMKIKIPRYVVQIRPTISQRTGLFYLIISNRYDEKGRKKEKNTHSHTHKNTTREDRIIYT
jgi:hypothetical protein